MIKGGGCSSQVSPIDYMPNVVTAAAAACAKKLCQLIGVQYKGPELCVVIKCFRPLEDSTSSRPMMYSGKEQWYYKYTNGGRDSIPLIKEQVTCEIDHGSYIEREYPTEMNF
ncbi:hypothetical protein OUZ56_031880 [Daphnia magna]|uniref:Uncharacterized protein n=1 Tax=Daphnia magna TaxID=35525 RepID=A0ABQ9ZVK2_9CRUS|nr:hypothetical protein OUZ56_031880 [Daphnia magna]